VTIDTNEVLRIAALARLELDEGSVETFRHQLKEILDYVGMLGELDVTDVPPTTHPLGRGQAERPDDVRPSLAVDEALANAPDAANDLFRVPRVLGG
jgi:aspartyl-tRNA(Asn)/glutamyl-tRNA(Gln) amidotransferase subunit C